MKKKYYWIIGMIVGLVVIVSCIIAIILLSNRGTASLRCVKTEKDTVTEGVSRFKINFKNDKIALLENENELIVKNDVLKTNIDKLYDTVQNQFKNYKNEKGIIIKTQKWSDKFSIIITVDAKANSERVGIAGFGIKSDMSYEAVKKILENQKFTCE